MFFPCFWVIIFSSVSAPLKLFLSSVRLFQSEIAKVLRRLLQIYGLRKTGFNASYEPTVAGLLASLLAVFFSSLVFAAQHDAFWNNRCCRSRCCRNSSTESSGEPSGEPSGASSKSRCGALQTACQGRMGCWIFGGFVQLSCFVVAILPMVNDGQGGIVETFHRNEDDYLIGLAISVPCFGIVLGCACAYGFLIAHKLKTPRPLYTGVEIPPDSSSPKKGVNSSAPMSTGASAGNGEIVGASSDQQVVE